MSYRYVVIAAISAFVLGLVIVPAHAVSAKGPWKKVAGHSTSCALVRSSVNDETRRAGTQTANFQGCSASNGGRAVPPGYIAAATYL